MDRERKLEKLTPSICEEALERFSRSDDTLAGLIEASNIEVREFMILSFVCDQHNFSVGQIMRALGLSQETAFYCTDRLATAGLVRINAEDQRDPAAILSPTPAGRIIVRRVLDADQD